MAIDIRVPIVLPQSADDYIASFGTATTAYLEYGTASPPADGTATTPLVSGTEHYEFALTGRSTSDYYRWRVGAGTAFSGYSPVFQVPRTYATLQEVLRGMDFPDASREDELEGLLIDATDYITNHVCGGRSFFRDPVGSGTKVLSLDIDRSSSVLSLARGRGLDIISLTTVEVADYTGASYITVASGSTGYWLVPDVPRAGWPYTDLVLSDQASTFLWLPPGYRTVRLTGVFGWETVPDLVKRATVDLVRWWWNSRGQDNEPVGMNAFGSPIFGAGVPKTVRDLWRSDYAWRGWVG